MNDFFAKKTSIKGSGDKFHSKLQNSSLQRAPFKDSVLEKSVFRQMPQIKLRIKKLDSDNGDFEDCLST